MKALVIGSGGYVGQKVAERLNRAPALQWQKSHMDLKDPQTFEAMLAHDIALNCADTIAAPPDAAIAYAMAHGKIWLESSAEKALMQRLYAQDWAKAKGSLILGVGLFPGLSNLLARQLWDAQPEKGRLELAVRVSPFSGAGAGTCELMVQMVHDIGQPKRFLFKKGLCPAYQLPLADGYILTHSLQTQVDTFLAPSPSWIAPFFRVPLPAALLRFQLKLIRSKILKNKATSVEILAQMGQARMHLAVSDGMSAIADASVAALQLLQAGSKPAPGIYSIEQLFTLDNVIQHMEHKPHLW